MDIERRMIVDKLISEEGRSWIKENFKTHWKNSEAARKFRIQGNSLFAKMSDDTSQMEEIHEVYSKSIAFAECGTDELAFGYGNRSAILLRMKKYKECITDIDSALKINNSEKFNVKLLCRKVECMKNLIGLNTESKKLFSEVESLVSIIKNEDTDKKTLKESMEKVKNMHIPCESAKVRNEEIPEHEKLLNKKENENPFDSVSIRWDKKYGRYLVANRDFNPGEIVFVEKTYVKVASVLQSHNYCGHCLKICWAIIPCNYCSWCMFCSEDCKKMSWKSYHDIECKVVAQLMDMKFGKLNRCDILTIRALILGIREAGSIQNLKDEIEKIDACTGNKENYTSQGLEKNDLFKNLGFKFMYVLNDKVNTIQLPKFTSDSVYILISLMKNTSLFDEHIECKLENILVNEELLFIGSLLLKLYKVNEINNFQLPGENPDKCKYFNDLMTCKLRSCCDRGFGINIITSLFNNDCNPQVALVYNKLSKMIACSLRPIKKDSPIFICYYGNCYEVAKDKRQTFFKTGYNFTCKCKACEENWPTGELNLDKLEKAYYHLVLEDFMDKMRKDKWTLEFLEIVSKFIGEAYQDLKHPSQTLWIFESIMLNILRKLYAHC